MPAPDPFGSADPGPHSDNLHRRQGRGLSPGIRPLATMPRCPKRRGIVMLGARALGWVPDGPSGRPRRDLDSGSSRHPLPGATQLAPPRVLSRAKRRCTPTAGATHHRNSAVRRDAPSRAGLAGVGWGTFLGKRAPVPGTPGLWRVSASRRSIGGERDQRGARHGLRTAALLEQPRFRASRHRPRSEPRAPRHRCPGPSPRAAGASSWPSVLSRVPLAPR
jgi:hypothetical protein